MGVTPPEGAATAIVTDDVCAVVIVAGDGVTVTTGATRGFTFTEPVPDDVAYAVELAVSGVYVAFSESVPAGRVPAGILIVAAPLLSVVTAEV